MPTWGRALANGYGAILGRAWEMAVEQRGFARVGITHEADLGDQPQLEQKFPLGAGFARLREARRLADAGGEVAVAEPAAAALAQHEPLPVLGEVAYQFALSADARDRVFDGFVFQVDPRRALALREVRMTGRLAVLTGILVASPVSPSSSSSASSSR
jgi:hypothetical protein